MRVRCLGRSIEDLPDAYVDVRKRLGEGPFPLTVGRTYVVYAIEARAGPVEYYIHDDERLGYPIWYAAPLFQVVDPALSRYWVCTYEVDDSGVGTLVLAFPEWAHDRFFYNDVVDGQPAAVRTYERYRRLLDAEESSAPPI